MKKKILNVKIIGLAILLCFAASSVWAQGGSGRITPTSRGTTKTTTTKKTTTKKPVVKTTTTKRTTTVRKPTGTTKTFEYYYSLGSAALDKDDYQGAITNFTSAIRLNARSADAYYNRGLAYLGTENYEAAIDDYTKSIQLKPAADAYNNRGLAYEYNGNYKLAADDYRTALRLQPGYALAQSNLERVQGQYDDGSYGDSAGDGSYANRNSTVSNNTNTNDSEYYAELADSYYDKNDFTNALINYNKAIQLNPQGAGSYVRRGFIYHYTGEVAKAYEDYDTAVRLNPALKNEAYIKCMIYDSSVVAEVAPGIRDCTTTINEFPSFSLAYYKRGVGYYSSKNYTMALQDFTKSIEIRPNFFNSMVYRGLIYSATDRPSMAVTEYTRAIQIIGANDFKAYLSYNNRGAAYEALGNYTQAAADYRKSLQLNPDFDLARENLDKVLKRQKGTF